MARCVFLLILVALSQVLNAYKILTVFPIPRKSHKILGEGIVRHLLEAGHEVKLEPLFGSGPSDIAVTHVTPFPSFSKISKYHEIDLSDVLRQETANNYTLQKLLDREVANDFADAIPRILKMTTLSMKSDNLRNFLSDTTQNFDAVIIEWFFSDYYAGYATVFNCPLIWLSAIEAHGLILKLTHEPSNPAFHSDAFTTAVPPFSFPERVRSLFRQIYIIWNKFFYFDFVDKTIYEEFFGPILAKRGRTLPAYEEAIFNGSFMLINSHSSCSEPMSVPLNSKEIGGYHVDPITKPLPQNLQKLMDEAKDGVIYFSMGTNAKSKHFPDVLKQELLKVLGALKQTVIWKFEEPLNNRPKNVHIMQWAPQQSILAHPNCRFFITHGGVLSTIEAIYFGIPTIVVPYGADQFLNAARAVKKGYALRVDLSYKMADEMKLALEQMLSNPKYTERVKALSKSFHDRLVPPGKELVHWVEHVVRTGGAPHLRSPALMLPWYQKMYLDLAGLSFVVLYSLKWLFTKLFSKKTQISNEKPAKCESDLRMKGSVP